MDTRRRGSRRQLLARIVDFNRRERCHEGVVSGKPDDRNGEIVLKNSQAHLWPADTWHDPSDPTYAAQPCS